MASASRSAALGNDIDVVSQFVLDAMRRFLTGLAEAWPFVTVHARAIVYVSCGLCVSFIYINFKSLTTRHQRTIQSFVKELGSGRILPGNNKTSVQFESVDIYPSVSELTSEQNFRFQSVTKFSVSMKQNVRFHVRFASRCLAYYIKNSVLIIRKEEQNYGLWLIYS